MKPLPPFFFLVAFFLAGLANARADLPRETPDCALTAWDNGNPVELRQFRGKVVYVDFWASWCTSCAQSLPFLNRLHEELENRGLIVLGINLDERPQDAAAFLTRHPAAFTLASTPDMACAKAFAVPGMPASFLIDRQGIIRSTHLGFRQSDAENLRLLITQLLDEAAPARDAR